MNIRKKNLVYTVKNLATKWKIETTINGMPIFYNVPKELCSTEYELKKYIIENNMFWGERMEKEEKKTTPQERYAKKYKKQYKIDCITRTEQDIIEKLESEPNKAGYIKRLIRADIQKDKKYE